MQMSEMHYLPLAPGFFAILVGFFFLILILRSVRYAYESLGVSSNAAIFLLLATLIGSFFNIPIAELPPEHVMSDQVVDFFGMRYAVPVVSDWDGTVVAVNVGGAVIPTLVSIYLLVKRELWVKGAVATAIVAPRRASGAPCGASHAQPASKLMKPVRFPPGWVSAVMEASRRYRHYSPLLAHK
jgi:uncharacterized membrane protein